MIGYETRRWLPADANERFYRLRRLSKKLTANEIPRTFEEVVSREHLFTSFRELQQQGGPAAGVDGVRLDEIGPSEFGRIAPDRAGAVDVSGTQQAGLAWTAAGQSLEFDHRSYNGREVREDRVNIGIGNRPNRLGLSGPATALLQARYFGNRLVDGGGNELVLDAPFETFS